MISYTLISTPTCLYQGVRNVSFSENFAYALNEWPPATCYISYTSVPGTTNYRHSSFEMKQEKMGGEKISFLNRKNNLC